MQRFKRIVYQHEFFSVTDGGGFNLLGGQIHVPSPVVEGQFINAFSEKDRPGRRGCKVEFPKASWLFFNSFSPHFFVAKDYTQNPVERALHAVAISLQN
jgi:hypothetical protein